MTDQRRGGAARGDEAPAPGYRGTLPPRNDNLAKPWVIVVAVIFVLIFALAVAKVPSTLFPERPTPIPTASVAPSGSGSASSSGSASGSAAASATASSSVSPSPSPVP